MTSQRCFYSSICFVICMQVLSMMLDWITIHKMIGHSYFLGTDLTQLCFADDLRVFSDGKKSSTVKNSGIQKICWMLWSKYHSRKVNFVCSPHCRRWKAILEEFPFDYALLIVGYLGLLSMTKWMTVNDYTMVIDIIKKRTGSWTARNLFFIGWLQLIESVTKFIEFLDVSI